MNGLQQTMGGNDHLQFNAGAAAKSAETDEMYEYSQALIVEAIISKFKWEDGEIREKFETSRGQLIETIDQFGFVPPSVKPKLLKNIPTSSFKDDIIFMLGRNKSIAMKESKWRKLFPDYEVKLESHEEPNSGSDAAGEQPANNVSETTVVETEDQASQVSGGENVESAPIRPGQVSPPADTKESGKKCRGRKEVAEIPEEVLEQIFKKDLPSDELTGELRLAKGISHATLAKRVSAKVGEIGPTYFSKFVNCGHFKPPRERMEAAAEVFGLKEGLWKDLFLDSWQNFAPHKKESSARSGRLGGTKKRSYKYVELPEIPAEVLAEIYSDQSLSPNDLIRRLAREKQVTQKQFAAAANMDAAYLSTLLNKPGHVFPREKVMAFADRLGQKGEDRDQFIARLGSTGRKSRKHSELPGAFSQAEAAMEPRGSTLDALILAATDPAELPGASSKIEAAVEPRGSTLDALILAATDPAGEKHESIGEANSQPAVKDELLPLSFCKLCASYGKELEKLAGEVNFTDAEQVMAAAVKITKALGLNDDEVAFLATAIELEFPDFSLTIASRGKGFAGFIITALARNLNAELVTA